MKPATIADERICNGMSIVRMWRHAGLDCLILRKLNQYFLTGNIPGHYCGYVRIPDGVTMPEDYCKLPDSISRSVPGGVDFCGEPNCIDGGEWYGFAMNHSWDDGPKMPGWPYGTYVRMLDEAVSDTESLADAMAAFIRDVHEDHHGCPFCGCREIGAYEDWEGYRVLCYRCEAEGPCADDEAGAWKLWDGRSDV